MKVLIIGGPRQGEWLELAGRDGGLPPTYVDLLTGDTYRIARISWAVEGPVKGVAAELYKLPIAVHPSLIGSLMPEQHAATLALYQVVAMQYMTDFMREHAEQLPMAEPDLADVVPDTPAEITEGGA